MAMIATIVGGVFERFPKLSIAYLESGIGWVPYLMDRLDEEVEKRGADEAPYLTMLPSEYIKSGRIYFGIECGKKPFRTPFVGASTTGALFFRLPALGRRLAAHDQSRARAQRSVGRHQTKNAARQWGAVLQIVGSGWHLLSLSFMAASA